MAWLGIDVGSKRTGVAISRSGTVATPWGIISGDRSAQIRQLCQLIETEQIKILVVGVPRYQPDQLLPEMIQAWLDELKPALGGRPLVIAYIDETLTTKEVERQLGTKRVRETDALAAQIILEDYFANR